MERETKRMFLLILETIWDQQQLISSVCERRRAVIEPVQQLDSRGLTVVARQAVTAASDSAAELTDRIERLADQVRRQP
jgi:hypothetical protein